MAALDENPSPPLEPSAPVRVQSSQILDTDSLESSNIVLEAPQSASTQAPSSLTTTTHANSADDSHQSGFKRVKALLSSSRLNVIIALVALAVAAYYFYSQYVISLKAWQLGIWKDCKDRPVSIRDSANSAGSG